MGYMFGLLIGSFLFGILSDKYGRRKALLVGALISGGLSLSMSFVKDYWSYFALRLFLGIFSKSLFMLAFMIAVEISGVNYKTYLGILIQVLKSEKKFHKRHLTIFLLFKGSFCNWRNVGGFDRLPIARLVPFTANHVRTGIRFSHPLVLHA